MPEAKARHFSYLMFGWLTYAQPALNGQRPPISDRMLVNNQTQDREMTGGLFGNALIHFNVPHCPHCCTNSAALFAGVLCKSPVLSFDTSSV